MVKKWLQKNLNLRCVCVWFRNDLRIHDNPTLFKALNLSRELALPILPVYIFDPRQYTQTKMTNSWKTGARRAEFILEAVLNLKKNIKSKKYPGGGNLDLLIKIGYPEEIFATLLSNDSHIFVQQEVTSEEIKAEAMVCEAVYGSTSKSSVSKAVISSSILTETTNVPNFHRVWGSTMFHPFDLDKYDCWKGGIQAACPDSHTAFKKKIMWEIASEKLNQDVWNQISKGVDQYPPKNGFPKVRELIQDMKFQETQETLKESDCSSDLLNFDFLPTFEDLPYNFEGLRKTKNRYIPVKPGEYCEKSTLSYRGGEDAAMERIDYYFATTSDSKKEALVNSYKETRNGLIGGDYSTKFAPWLACGCLSPRLVFHHVRDYENNVNANISTYWILFEMSVRDFMRFYCWRYQDAVFKEYGVKSQMREGHQWVSDPTKALQMFESWKNGTTGHSFVDANMRELNETGFMSNRGRQNVASYLIFDLKINWRWGAEYFEQVLIDHDVCSNWGNWLAAAALTGLRPNRFNCSKQAKDYDPDGSFVKLWGKGKSVSEKGPNEEVEEEKEKKRKKWARH